MTQLWNGQYTYGVGYPEALKGTSVAFRLLMTEDNGAISGTCTDDEGDKVFTEPATFIGFIDNDIISFIKKYPSYWETDEKGNLHLYNDIPPVDIHYYGNYLNEVFSGDWEMEYELQDQQGEWHYVGCGGTWSMVKAESL